MISGLMIFERLMMLLMTTLPEVRRRDPSIFVTLVTPWHCHVSHLVTILFPDKYGQISIGFEGRLD